MTEDNSNPLVDPPATSMTSSNLEADLVSSPPIFKQPKSVAWLRWAVLSFLALVIAALGYHFYQKQPNNLLKKENSADSKTDDNNGKKGKGGAASVTVVASKKQTISMSQTLPATVVALQQVIVRPTQTGQVVGIYFKDGQYVKQGQLLAKLDDRAIQTSISNAKAVLHQNQVQLATNLKTQERYQSLLKDNAVSRQEVDQIVGQTNLIQAQSATSETQLQSALVQLANTEIRAPFSGVVGVHKVSVGSMVTATDTNGIVTLTQVNPIAVSFGIPTSLQTGRAIKGLPVEIWSMADDGHLLASSHISAVDGQIDASGNLPVQAKVENANQQLTVGQPVKVKLITKQYTDAITVPLAAVKNGLTGQYVMTVQPSSDGKTHTAKRQDIEVIAQNDEVAIVNNLPAGVMVIIDGNNKVRDGSSIKPVVADQQGHGGNGDEKKGSGHKHKNHYSNNDNVASQQPNASATNTNVSATGAK